MQGVMGGRRVHRCVRNEIITGDIYALFFCFLTMQFAGYDDYKSSKNGMEIENNVKMVEQIFSDVDDATQKESRLDYFIVTAKIAETQLQTSGGIDIELQLVYNGRESIAIHNPLYFLQITMTDEHGVPLQLKQRPPIPLVHKKIPIDPDEDFVFMIRRISRNDRETDITEAINKTTVKFHKGESYAFNIRLKEYVNPDTNELDRLPRGVYSLQLLLSLVQSGEKGSIAKSESRMLRIEKVEVTVK